MQEIGSLTVEGDSKKKSARQSRFAPVTSFFLALCVIVFLLNYVQEKPMRKDRLADPFFILTPIQKELLFDVPSAALQYEAFVREHRILPSETVEDLDQTERAEIEQILRTPLWRGIYDWTVFKIKTGDGSSAEGPMFVKIREGQIWRLFTPCILHGDFWHILFNMVWLWILGRPIEQRIGSMRTLLLTLAVGIVSNTLQYLMSGPLFLGYSGVVTGLAGFTWMRERIAPWEGYPLPRATILFLAVFVLAMFALQIILFFIQIFTDLSVVLILANTAHIAGALAGASFGRMNFFAWRVK